MDAKFGKISEISNLIYGKSLISSVSPLRHHFFYIILSYSDNNA